MPERRKRIESAPESDCVDAIAAPLEKIARLLALLAVKGESQPEKIKVLSGAGFSNTEIAKLLGLTPNAVELALRRLRRKK